MSRVLLGGFSSPRTLRCLHFSRLRAKRRRRRRCCAHCSLRDAPSLGAPPACAKLLQRSADPAHTHTRDAIAESVQRKATPRASRLQLRLRRGPPTESASASSLRFKALRSAEMLFCEPRVCGVSAARSSCAFASCLVRGAVGGGGVSSRVVVHVATAATAESCPPTRPMCAVAEQATGSLISSASGCSFDRRRGAQEERAPLEGLQGANGRGRCRHHRRVCVSRATSHPHRAAPARGNARPHDPREHGGESTSTSTTGAAHGTLALQAAHPAASRSFSQLQHQRQPPRTRVYCDCGDTEASAEWRRNATHALLGSGCQRGLELAAASASQECLHCVCAQVQVEAY